MANVIPREVKKEVVDGYLAETWKVCLLYNTFTYVAGTHVNYTDVLASEVVGGNYTTGGATLTKLAWGAGSGYTATDAKLDAQDLVWSNITFVGVRYALIYNAASPFKIRDIKDLKVDQTVTNGSFTLTVDANGVLKVSQA